MSRLAAAFFCWLQNTPVYSSLHAQAVALMPPGAGRSWLDVGCGPGLVARLASARGYAVLGIDKDRDMIRSARWHARRDERCRFEVGELGSFSTHISADVVSAASLLFVVPDPASSIRELWSRVRPGGNLLVVETSELMTPAGVQAVSRGMHLRDSAALKLWGRARCGRSVIPQVSGQLSPVASDYVPLLEGLVQARIWTKPADWRGE